MELVGCEDVESRSHEALASLVVHIGDEFLENDNGEYIHRECIPGIMWLTDFLGYKFKEMEDFNDDE